MEKQRLDRVAKSLAPLLQNALENGVFSGVAVGVYLYRKGREQRLITSRGQTRTDEPGKAISQETFFDLASLTKPLCTALSILCLIQKKGIDWNTKIFNILPFAIHSEYISINIDQLLTHSAGLLAYKPVYQSFSPLPGNENKEKIIQTFLREKLAYPPGSSCLYSDIGFILLGALIEKISGTTLDIFFNSEIATPFQVQNNIQFRPLDRIEKKEKNIAATELCPWRQKLLQGEVHDEHAWLMNGVAGHAGLFGTIAGVLALTEHLLHQWKGRTTHPGFSNTLLQLALTKKYTNQSWCRGFDTPAAQGSSAGIHFSASSVGHLGYTGTSFWIDPEQDMVVVLLSNRVHPSRKNEQIKQFRPLLHNTVQGALREK
jgi:CubicO group peptidase (beta-lactamase class C family)